MPYCPKCSTEYRPGFDTCANCQVALVEELPPLPEPEPMPSPVDFGEPKLLLTVDSGLDANILLAFLEDNGIPAFKKFGGSCGSLQVIFDINYSGAKIFVPEKLFAKAQELVEVYFSSTYDGGECLNECVNGYTDDDE